MTRLGLLTIATALSCHIDGFGMAIPAVLFFHAVYEAAFVTPTQVHAKRSPSRFALPLALIIGGTCALPYLSWRALHLFGQGDVHALPSAPSPFSLLIQRLVAASPFGLSLKSVPFGLPPMLVMTCLAVVVAGGILASQFVPRSWIDRSMSVLFAIHLLLPLAAFFLMTLVTGTDMLEKRYFIMAVPGLVVLLTLGWLSVARFLPGIDFVLLLIVPLLVTVMWLRQGVARSSSDWRTLYSRIAPEIRPGDGFLHEAFINYPLYPLGPIRSYAYRSGSPIEEQRCADYHTTLTADEVNVSLLTASTWESDQERSRIEDFILNCPSSRVWTLSSDFSRMRMLDLSSRARLLKEFESPGVNAKLWRIESRRAASQYAQTPQAPRAPGAGGVR